LFVFYGGPRNNTKDGQHVFENCNTKHKGLNIMTLKMLESELMICHRFFWNATYDWL